MANLDGTDDVFDSREVIERIAELEADLEGYEDPTGSEWDDQVAELESLKALQEEAKAYISDFEYGEAFISADYFTDYAKELVGDMGYLPEELPWWIADNIDWDGVADALKEDYTEFEFHGTTYYAR